MSRLFNFFAASKDTKRCACHSWKLEHVSVQRSVLSSAPQLAQFCVYKHYIKPGSPSKRYAHTAVTSRTVRSAHDEGKRSHERQNCTDQLGLGVSFRKIGFTRHPRPSFRDSNGAPSIDHVNAASEQLKPAIVVHDHSSYRSTDVVEHKPLQIAQSEAIKSNSQNTVTYQGLWSSEAYLQKSDTCDDVDNPADSERNEPLLAKEIIETDTQASLDSWNTIGSLEQTLPSNSVSGKREFDTTESVPSNWRKVHYLGEARRGRWMTKKFMQHIYHQVPQDIEFSDEALKFVLNECGLSLSEDDQQKCIDILNWSWILLADGSLSVKRLVALATLDDVGSSQAVPLWVILQILQAEKVYADSLHLLLYYITRVQARWDFGHGDSAMLLAVRLLRHARRSAPSCYEPIANLFLELMSMRPLEEAHRSDSVKLVGWFNRMLSLIAIPASIDPYRSVVSQQTSQLDIVSYMQESGRHLPLNREGYRALAKLQLMHAKTDVEKDWARGKALTWPPFQRQHQMGGSVSSNHPGERSRVMKVFRRMQEAGYAPHEFDVAAQILAGWDTDSTPTVQTRTSARSIQIRKMWEPGKQYNELNLSPIIWAARVEATRTVREAWMCFCAYYDRTKGTTQSARVYHAMFKKLLASPKAYSDGGSLPGDGRESFPDSDLPRDLVYVPEQIPSIQEFYSRMLSHGIRPHGTLLSDLLVRAASIEQGLRYIRDAQIPPEVKQVLRRPGNCDNTLIQEVLPKLPAYLLRSYVSFMVSPTPGRPQEWHAYFRARDVATGFNNSNFSCLSTAQAMLVTAQITDMSVWNMFFTALAKHTDSFDKSLRRLQLDNVWTHATGILFYSELISMPDFRTFLPLANIGYKLQTWNRITSVGQPEPIHVMKGLFMKAAIGVARTKSKQWHRFCRNPYKVEIFHSIPTGDNIESMVWLLACDQSTSQVRHIVDLLFWLNHNREQITWNDRRITKHNMCAFRAYLEGRWVEELFPEHAASVQLCSASPEQLNEAKELSEPFGWPSDETMSWYLNSRWPDFHRMLSKILSLQESAK